MANPNKSANPMNWRKMEFVEKQSFSGFRECQAYKDEKRLHGYYVREKTKMVDYKVIRTVFVYKKVKDE